MLGSYGGNDEFCSKMLCREHTKTQRDVRKLRDTFVQRG